MLMSDSILVDIFTVLVAVAATLIALIKWRYTYWARVGLEYPEPTFPLGNFWESIRRRRTNGEDLEHFYFQMKAKGQRHLGLFFFHMPIYVPIDPEIVKHIMQVDFDHFVDRGLYYNEKDDPLSAHLFSLEGAKWRNLRAKLTPTFTSGKMKMMFPIVVRTAEQMIDLLDGLPSGEAVEFKDILARLTTDIIGTCAFGLDCNSLRDPDTEFRTQGKKFFTNRGFQRLRILFTFMCPNLMKSLNAKVIPSSLSDFFTRVVSDTIEYRERKDVKRNDFMQLLIEMKSDGKTSNQGAVAEATLTFDELAAQAFVFFLAGFESSSTTMSYVLYELAVNQDVQEKVRSEINSVLKKHNGELSYEAVMDMHYMDKVVYEALRIYPALPSINRMVTKDYKVPNTDVVLEKGVRVFIPVQALQHDPEYFPNSDIFDPSRFDDDQKQSRHPFTYLPFGEGPRVCIGMRFGMMQTKVGLTVLLKNYTFRLNPLTRTPLKRDPSNFLNAIFGGMWMDIEKIDAENGNN